MNQHPLLRAVGITAFVLLTHAKTFSQTDWHVTGNAGTNPTSNFIGTTDSKPIIFKVNNIKAGIVSGDTTGNTALGVLSQSNFS